MFQLASNGIVIATEKKPSSILIDESMIEKVAVICPNIGMSPESWIVCKVLIAVMFQGLCTLEWDRISVF